jgi:hypothetical protein
MVIVHLFAEYPDVAKDGILKFTIPGGGVVMHSMPTRNGVHVREIVASLVVTIDAAEALGKFFRDQSEKAKQAMAQGVHVSL